MGLQAEDLKSRYLYNTNYVIWDNIGLEQQDKNIPAYQIMSEVFERLGIHSGTIFNYHQEPERYKELSVRPGTPAVRYSVRQAVCL